MIANMGISTIEDLIEMLKQYDPKTEILYYDVIGGFNVRKRGE